MRRWLMSSLLVVGFAAFALPSLAPSVASAATVALPTVKGGFNQTPTITFPASKPPSSLQVKLLHKGTGPKVVAGQLLAANYVGQIWQGKVFDSSFARGQLSSFPIGIGEVIPGWDKGLVGVPVGSEVLLVIPPADGYGSSGNTGAGITGTDTIVFVVDVSAAYGSSIEASPKAKLVTDSTAGVTVTGKPGSVPKVSVKKGATQPKSVSTYVLYKGSGATIKAGLVVMQLIQTDWTGKLVASTWEIKTPYGANIGVKDDPSIFDKLIGLKLGSRVLVLLPKISSGGPYVVVADLISQPKDGATS